MSLANRNVLITGGSVGIGRDIAIGMAAKGAAVTLIARNETELAATVAELPLEGFEEHSYFAMDVASSSDWERFGEWRKSRSAFTDLISSAGIYGPIGPIGSYDVDEFARTLDINLTGTVRAVQHVLADLKANAGSVLLLAGGGAATPNPNFTAYGTSKAAIVRFAENISLELAAKNVIVNSCAPGFINTRLHEQTMAAGSELVGEGFYEKTKEITSGSTGDNSDHVVELAQFLLDPDNDRFTGKFVSAVWDGWREPEFRERLRNEPNLATSRRIDNMFFGAIDSTD